MNRNFSNYLQNLVHADLATEGVKNEAGARRAA